MWQDWLFEFLKGFGKLFLHPLFYVSFLLAAYLGVSRVKMERKEFTIRAKNAYYELRQLLPMGIIIGLCLSILSIGLVLVVPMELIIYTGAFTILLVLLGKTRLLSPAYTLGLGLLATMASLYMDWDFFLFSKGAIGEGTYIFPTAVAVLGLLLAAEGLLMEKNGSKGTSPRLKKSSRGQSIGIHLSERVWLVPMFLFLPNGILSIPIEGWPAFTVGNETYSFIFVPFLLGFRQAVQGMHPTPAIKAVGRKVFWLGILIALSAAAAYFIPLAAIGSILVAIICREWITASQKAKEKNKAFYFTKKNNGIMILGVVPESPADKMDLKVGEVITKVNSISVHDEIQLYRALQKNSAHCKIEVLDINGEVRFAQRALYEGDYHKLGILMIQDDKARDDAAV